MNAVHYCLLTSVRYFTAVVVSIVFIYFFLYFCTLDLYNMRMCNSDAVALVLLWLRASLVLSSKAVIMWLRLYCKSVIV